MIRSARRLTMRIGVSLSLLALLAVVVEPGDVLARLAGLRPGWVAAALAVSVLQVAVSAWRWRFTALRLGVRIPFRVALLEYYLGTFLNQVLPGGVLGDVSRAWRHARRAGRAAERGSDASRADTLRSVHAVVLERTSGQAVMTAVAVLSAAVLLLPRTGRTEALLPGHPLADIPVVVAACAAVVVAAVGAWLVGRLTRRVNRLPALHRFLGDAKAALLGTAFPAQLAASVTIVASYMAVFVLAARAVGVTTPAGALTPLVAPVLVTMLIPVSIAGWGVREGAAAALWISVGLTAADGVAISVAYGLLVLVSSLPGAAVMLLTLRADRARDRRGRRSPGESAGPGAEAPRRASRSAEG